MNSRLRLAFLCFFGTWLISPMAFIMVPTKFCTPVDENRKLHELPAWTTIRSPASLGIAADSTCAWFEDHFGLRDLMIRCKNQIDFTIFARSEKVHVGSQGWLFVRSPLDSYLLQLERLPLAFIDDRVNEMDVLAKDLDSRGIKLIVLVIPLKWTVYSEFLPSSAPKLPDIRVRRSTYWTKKLCERRSFRTILALDPLLAMKSTTDSFYKTDYHWSHAGALQISKELLTLTAQTTGTPVPESRFHNELQLETMTGDSSRYLPIWRQPTEQALVFRTKEPYPPQDIEPPFQMVFRNTGDSLLPTTVFLGDSFFWNMYFGGFQSHFRELYFGHIQRPSYLDILRNPPNGTRTIILELLESNYPIGFHL